MKLCPKCSSIEVMPVAGGITGTWRCKKCGFSGTLFPDVERIKKEKVKIKRKNQKKEEKNKRFK